jgi:pyrimidine-nucleoside phosphorylase
MDAHRFRRAVAAKRDGERLSEDLWRELVTAYLAGVVDDAPMAALLMACLWRGLDASEAGALTAAFVASGERLVSEDPRTVDKHSTGGVGDTASLIAVPLVAACGVPVAKLSGRALGHTGGTLDKLEAVPGVRVDLSPDAFARCVREAGCAIAAQSDRLVPADKRIYALRDRTATVPSLGLIAASIVSKKIAGGARGIVYDVKTGRGAFLPGLAEARELARALVEITSGFGPRAVALVTDMEEPLGPAIGAGLEAIEARDFLGGERRDPRLEAVALALGAAMLAVAGEQGDRAALTARVRDALESGAAAERFERMLVAQGAFSGALATLAPHPSVTRLLAHDAGIVERVDPIALGEAARDLMARSGPLAGLVVRARIGDRVEHGAPLVEIRGEPSDEIVRRVRDAFVLGTSAPPTRPLVYEGIGSGVGAVTGTRA